MCKFTNRLFVLVLLQFIGLAMAKPLKARSSASDLIELLYNDYGDYGYQLEEVNYDQRQKGEENLKLRLDGFLIGLPARDDSSWLDLLAEEYLSEATQFKKFQTKCVFSKVTRCPKSQHHQHLDKFLRPWLKKI